MRKPDLSSVLYAYSRLICMQVVLVLLFVGCGTGHDFVVSFQDLKGLTVDAELRYEDVIIGKVVKLDPSDASAQQGSVDVYLALSESSYQRFVKTDGRFILRQDSAAGKTYVQLVVFNKDSASLPTGSKVIGAENELELRVQQFNANLWKNLAVVAIAVVILLSLVYLFRIVLRFGAILIALGCALVGSNYLSGHLARELGKYLPTDYRPDLVAFVITAIAIYFGVALVFWIFLRPFRKKSNS